MLSTTSMNLSRWSFRLIYIALLLIPMMTDALNSAALRGMSSLHLHLLNSNLILCTIGTGDKTLSLLLLLLLVTLL